MMKKVSGTVIEELLKQENTRQNLSRLRSLIKEHECKVQAYELLKEHDDLLISFLASEDAKTRKNAALLIFCRKTVQLSLMNH